MKIVNIFTGVSPQLNWNFAYAQPTLLIFGILKYADNIYYFTKNHVRGLCVGGDMTILFLVRSIIKWTYFPLRTTHALNFWYSNIYCKDLLPYKKSGVKNQGKLWIGGVLIPHTEFDTPNFFS